MKLWVLVSLLFITVLLACSPAPAPVIPPTPTVPLAAAIPKALTQEQTATPPTPTTPGKPVPKPGTPAATSPVLPPATTSPPAPSPVPTITAPTPPPTASPKITPTVTLPTTEVDFTRNIEYGKAGNISLLLDIYAPKKPVTSPMPAVIWIHGGGWRTGDKYPSQVQMLARRGFFTVSINYRLSDVATFPAAAEDSKCAVRWLRANAKKHNVDPERIGVWGGSAGGHLAMLVGTADEMAGLEGDGGWKETSSRVQAVCSFFGPGDFTVFPVPYFLGGTYNTIPGTYRLASPVTHVSKDDPTLLMVHGDMDQTVPLSQSEIMLRAYQQAGLEATLVKVAGAGHGFTQAADKPISPSAKEIDQMVLEFFAKHLLSAR